MASWSDLPNEIVEHILRYCCADGLRNEVFLFGRLDLWCFEHNPAVCGIKANASFILCGNCSLRSDVEQY